MLPVCIEEQGRSENRDLGDSSVDELAKAGDQSQQR